MTAIAVGDLVEVRQMKVAGFAYLARLEPHDPIPSVEEVWVPAKVATVHDNFIGVTFADGTPAALERHQDDLPFQHRRNWRKVHGHV